MSVQKQDSRFRLSYLSRNKHIHGPASQNLLRPSLQHWISFHVLVSFKVLASFKALTSFKVKTVIRRLRCFSPIGFDRVEVSPKGQLLFANFFWQDKFPTIDLARLFLNGIEGFHP